MSNYPQTKNFSSLAGKIFSSVKQNGDEVHFVDILENEWKLYHDQDCCENVFIESVVGDLSDLVGTPILSAEEVQSDDPPMSGEPDSYTWTFYKLATNKGYVTIRFYGTSSGYYSESATLWQTIFVKSKLEKVLK